MEIKFHIGRKCNLRCLYCHVDKLTTNEPSYMDALDNIISKHNVETIDKLLITGGEPTLYHDDVIHILNKYHQLDQISITSNGTNADKLIEYSRYKNVLVGVSYDGHINDRGFDSFETIKTLSELNTRFTVLYVISNTNYKHIYDDIVELQQIVPDIETRLEMIFMKEKEVNYHIDWDIMQDQISELYSNFPHLNIFRRNKSKKCPAIHKDDYLIEIRDGVVYNGCINYAYSQDQSVYKLPNYSSSEANKCNSCNIDVCHSCINVISGMLQDLRDFKDDGRYYNIHYCKFYRLVQDVVDTKNRNDFLLSKLNHSDALELMISSDCNLRCKYCFETKSNDLMTKDVIDGVIHLINQKSNIRELVLFGGEPLMKSNVNILEYLADKIIRLDKNISISIITNGQDLTDNRITNIISQLNESGVNVRVQISIDNIKEINDKYRLSMDGSSSFNKAINSLIYLKELIPYQRISVNSVINYDELPSLINWIQELDHMIRLKHINSFTLRLNQIQKDPLSHLQVKKLMKFYRTIIQLYQNGIIMRKTFKSVMEISNVVCDHSSNLHSHGCRAGISYFTIKPSGDIVPCHILSDYIIGSIKSNQITATDNIYQILDEIDVCGSFRSLSKECSHCDVFDTCVKCKGSNLILNRNSREMNSVNCQVVSLRNSIMSESGIELKEFIKLTFEQRKELLEDIHQLENMYSSNVSTISDDDRLEILECVEKMTERLLD